MKKYASAHGFKVSDVILNKGQHKAVEDGFIAKGSADDPQVKVNRILAKAARNPGALSTEELEYIKNYSKNYTKFSAQYDEITPGAATKAFLSDADYQVVKAAEDAGETDDDLAKLLEQAQISGNTTRVQMLKAEMRNRARNREQARAKAREDAREDSRSKAARMAYGADPRRVSGNGNLNDTTGPAFAPPDIEGQGQWESDQVTGDEPFAQTIRLISTRSTNGCPVSTARPLSVKVSGCPICGHATNWHRSRK